MKREPLQPENSAPLQKRKRVRIPENPAPMGFFQSIGAMFTNPNGAKEFIRMLEEAARTGNTEKLSVFIEPFRQQYPEHYEFAESLVDAPAENAAAALMNRWPWLKLIMQSYGPGRYLPVIRICQTEIKARRGGSCDQHNQSDDR